MNKKEIFQEPIKSNEEIESLLRQILNNPFEVINYEKKMSYEDYLYDFSRRRRGACSAKHYFLGHELEKNGFIVYYQTTPFYWNQLQVFYPSKIKNLAERMPIQFHLSLKIKLHNTWQLIDVSWDPPLAKAGFSINKIDSRTMTLAVLPAGQSIFHTSGKERFNFISRIKNSVPKEGTENEFYKNLNDWLETLR